MNRVAVAYINEDGDLWIERGVAPWPAIQHEAAAMAAEISDSGKVRYEGIQVDVRVSDNNEASMVHGDDDGCADSQFGGDPAPDGWEPCCRTVEAHHFRAVEA